MCTVDPYLTDALGDLVSHTHKHANSLTHTVHASNNLTHNTQHVYIYTLTLLLILSVWKQLYPQSHCRGRESELGYFCKFFPLASEPERLLVMHRICAPARESAWCNHDITSIDDDVIANQPYKQCIRTAHRKSTFTAEYHMHYTVNASIVCGTSGGNPGLIPRNFTTDFVSSYEKSYDRKSEQECILT